MKYFFVFLLFTLSACGPASNYVTVKLLTPIGMGQGFHQLQNDFLAGPLNLDLFSATHCYQPDLFVGYNDQVDSNLLKLTPLKIRSERGTAGTYGFNSWLKSHSNLEEPITVSVLKGQALDIAIMGAFYEPSSGTTANICEEVYSSVARPTLSVVGHKVINVTAPQTLTLDVWGMDYDANPATITPPAGVDPSSGAFFSCNDYPTNQICAGKDLVKMTTGDPSNLKIKKVEYFHNSDQTLKVTQSFEGMVGIATVWLPHYFPMTVTYQKSDTNIATQTITNPSELILDPTYPTYPNRKIQFNTY